MPVQGAARTFVAMGSIAGVADVRWEAYSRVCAFTHALYPAGSACDHVDDVLRTTRQRVRELEPFANGEGLDVVSLRNDAVQGAWCPKWPAARSGVRVQSDRRGAEEF